jgi:hypothetical protein
VDVKFAWVDDLVHAFINAILGKVIFACEMFISYYNLPRA